MTLIGDLTQYGIIKTKPRMSEQMVGEYRKYLSAKPVYRAHTKAYSDGVGTTVDDALEKSEVACYDMASVITAPHVWEMGVLYLRAAEAYFNEPAKIYSLNAFWVGPGKADIQGIQNWHRDQDDRKFLALFIYGSDVLEEADGPHLFKKGTHVRNGNGDSAVEDGEVETIYGPAGTMFLADTFGFHRGIKPARGKRLLSWVRYCVSEPPAIHAFDHPEPAPLAAMAGRVPAELEERVRMVVR